MALVVGIFGVLTVPSILGIGIFGVLYPVYSVYSVYPICSVHPIYSVYPVYSVYPAYRSLTGFHDSSTLFWCINCTYNIYASGCHTVLVPLAIPLVIPLEYY